MAKTRTRRRGVRLSSVRLTEALTHAGLKSRAAVADRIADLEELDDPPRDVVYRAFREQPVDVRTANRVAVALGVSMHELLLTSSEVDPAPADPLPDGAPDSRAEQTPPPRTTSRLIVAAAAVAVVVFGWMTDNLSRQVARPSTGAGTVSSVTRDLAKMKIVVRPFAAGVVEGFGSILRDRLEGEVRAVSLVGLGEDAEAPDVAARFGADLAIEGEIVTAGRHAGIRIIGWAPDRRFPIWATNVAVAELDERHYARFADEIVAALQQESSADIDIPGWESAQNLVIQGYSNLDQSRTELNVKRALTSFEAALRDSPDYADAHAGLCMALQQENLRNSDPRTTKDAERSCGRAVELAPGLRTVRLASAILERRAGRVSEADALLDGLLEERPDDVDALLQKAETMLARYRNTGDSGAASTGVEFAQRAFAIEPAFWKVPFTLARVEFLTGHVDAAIEAGAAAVEADANVFSLSNLGTSYFCRGDHDEAASLFMRARNLNPSSSAGIWELCASLYFARRYDDAIRACTAAVAADEAGGSSPSRHEMWGNLADAHRQAGHDATAADLYARAAELAERDLLAKSGSPNDRAHLAYYYTMLSQLDEDRVPAEIVSKLEPELLDAVSRASDPQALIRIASALPFYGRYDEARAAFDKGTSDCPGFGASPDLDVLTAGSPRNAVYPGK